ncbi:NHL domain-containing protein [Pontibacter cellulosilyticus]|uniref:Cadherin-like beta sandwich domain-containing protein n=1 Tax=Pontibacter cellulosilyticus TaxID=1720253 RepID=A0A923N834_9BACT|nr:cadherin-like beta sandwich domain-containing protein [Pontibacter cellulosilyticus]MBC5992597.1 cadherin-like beta sandwich domain-containing protein [Pontibacter cellulosilyticus]
MAIQANFNNPRGVALDSEGNIYIADRDNHLVRRVYSESTISNWAGNGTIGSAGEGDGGPATEARLNTPYAVAVDVNNNLYIVEQESNRGRVRKVDSALGRISTVAGGGSDVYYMDGPAVGAVLKSPAGIAVDIAGNLYVANGSRIHKVSQDDGSITTIAGSEEQGYSGDGSLATNAVLHTAVGVAVDNNGNVYFSDIYYGVVRKIDKNGIISTIAGGGALGNIGDGGPATGAYLDSPTGLAVDSEGNLFIAESGGDRIRKVSIDPLSSNANLSSLSLSTSYLPVFDPNTTAYSASVINAVTAVMVTPTVADAMATVTVNGTATESGKWVQVPLVVGKNTIPVVVTAQDGTTKTYTMEVTRAYAPLALTTSQTNVLCYDGTTGSATVSVTGGVTPYTYSWSPVGGTAATASNLKAGTYTVTVTDAQSQTVSSTVSITQPSTLSASISKTDVTMAGGADGTATVVAEGGTSPYTYAWSPSGGTDSKATGLTAGTYTVIVKDANNCSITKSITIVDPAANPAETVWLGAKSGNWHDADNWSNGVPTSAKDIVIKAGTYMPDIPNNEPNPGYSARNLTIEAGATFNLKTILDLYGNFTNNGSFVSYSNMSGDIYQTVSRVHVHKPATFGGSSPIPFYELWLENGATVNMATDVSVLYTLSLKSDLNTNGKKLTMLSQKWYAVNVENIGGVVNGTVTVQRHIDNSFNTGSGYRHFSSPVANSTVADLATTGYSPVTNAAYNTAEDPYAVKPFPTVLGYDQSRLSNATDLKKNFNYGWYSPASSAASLVPGVGYSLNISASAKVDFVGTLNNGDITVSNLGKAATGAAGWHLLGNPYPSTLAWVALNKPEGMDDAIYVFRSTGQYAGNYISYVNGVGNDEANYIAAMQGFFVRVNSGPVDLTFTNSARSTYSGAKVYRTAADTRPKLQLKLVDKVGLGDEAFVYFQEGTSTVANGKYDAYKVLTYNEDRPTLFARVNADALAIKGLPVDNTVQTLPLEIYVPVSGEYIFSVAKLVNFATASKILLEDRETNQTYDLKQTNQLNVHLSPSTDPHRFVLRFSALAGSLLSSGDETTTGVHVLVYPNPGNENINIAVSGLKSNTGTVQVKLLNSLGQEVLNQAYSTQQVQTGVQLLTTGFAAGVYHMQLQIGDKVITKKLVLQR